VHLVETLHLNLGIKQRDNRRDWSNAQEGPTRLHFANAVQQDGDKPSDSYPLQQVSH
jgi:hypothetical protein